MRHLLTGLSAFVLASLLVKIQQIHRNFNGLELLVTQGISTLRDGLVYR